MSTHVPPTWCEANQVTAECDQSVGHAPVANEADLIDVVRRTSDDAAVPAMLTAQADNDDLAAQLREVEGLHAAIFALCGQMDHGRNRFKQLYGLRTDNPGLWIPRLQWVARDSHIQYARVTKWKLHQAAAKARASRLRETLDDAFNAIKRSGAGLHRKLLMVAELWETQNCQLLEVDREHLRTRLDGARCTIALCTGEEHIVRWRLADMRPMLEIILSPEERLREMFDSVTSTVLREARLRVVKELTVLVRHAMRDSELIKDGVAANMVVALLTWNRHLNGVPPQNHSNILAQCRTLYQDMLHNIEEQNRIFGAYRDLVICAEHIPLVINTPIGVFDTTCFTEIPIVAREIHEAFTAMLQQHVQLEAVLDELSRDIYDSLTCSMSA
ncbi:hypothetical protein BV20DRAFT_981240 [Pilatotrama ljubarskyi]|nr:hypothetical protein BV20DRAFT_981240 [Pilatotrama ljubarskyi]